MSEQEQNKVRTITKQDQNKVRTRSEQCQSKVKTMSEQGQNKVKTMSEQGQNMVSIRSEQGQNKFRTCHVALVSNVHVHVYENHRLFIMLASLSFCLFFFLIHFQVRAGTSIRDFVHWLVCWSVGRSPYCLNAFFSAVSGWIDLKYGRDLHVDCLFQFLLFFFSSSSSSNSSFFSFSFFSSSEIKVL